MRYWPGDSIVRVLEGAGFRGFTWEALTVPPSTAAQDVERARRCAETRSAFC